MTAARAAIRTRIRARTTAVRAILRTRSNPYDRQSGRPLGLPLLIYHRRLSSASTPAMGMEATRCPYATCGGYANFTRSVPIMSWGYSPPLIKSGDIRCESVLLTARMGCFFCVSVHFFCILQFLENRILTNAFLCHIVHNVNFFRRSVYGSTQ